MTDLEKNVTISFTCTSNVALLMIAFHDIITGAEPEDSVSATTCYAWIIDELGTRADEFIFTMETTLGKEIADKMRELAKIYEG